MNELNTVPPRPIDSSALESWSDQEIVDYTLSVWAARGFTLSISEGGSCRYRGAEAGPCLIGLILADSCYDESLEGKTVYDVGRRLLPQISSGRLSLLSHLQSLHDSRPARRRHSLERLLARLRHFASLHAVKIPPGVYDRLDQLIQECEK